MEFRISYFKEALKEPINIGGLLLSGAAAAPFATTGVIAPALGPGGRVVKEGCYCAPGPTFDFLPPHRRPPLAPPARRAPTQTALGDDQNIRPARTRSRGLFELDEESDRQQLQKIRA